MTVYGGDPIYADDINLVAELLDSASALTTTAVTPLVSTANVDTAFASLAYEFVSGYAYEIRYFARVQIAGGTSPFVSSIKLRRASASGTLIHDPGGTAIITTNFLALDRTIVVKRTGATTTQTLVACLNFSSTGSPTSIDLEAASSAPCGLIVRPVGLATNHSGAPEIATS